MCRRAPLMANVFIDKYLLGGVDAVGSPGTGARQETFEPTCDWMPSISFTNISLSPSIASYLGWQDVSPLQLMHLSLLRKLGPHNLPASLHLCPLDRSTGWQLWEAWTGRVCSALPSSFWEYYWQGC